MKLLLALSLACITAHADDGQAMLSSTGGQLTRSTFTKGLHELKLGTAPAAVKLQSRDAQMSSAIASAAKKDFIQEGIEASRKALLACQQETSAVLVMPSLRSDSQQAHCYRF
ncbi:MULTISPECIES: hypothetical protein [unclassified Duganella]|uniref:hypothetical protein n=1 Tax=unclassified Duganella TaxID=2636909 RepID=UPI0008750E29|nr:MULTISPECIES: hypothetical protein [unclassified Duganella]OEZ63631.1 hypothetical protein DUGA6_01320 [Duganella sp. HH105]OFA03729.1 hypothetical protein DUGA2_27670 [Duganella sp. HH101]